MRMSGAVQRWVVLWVLFAVLLSALVCVVETGDVTLWLSVTILKTPEAFPIWLFVLPPQT